MPIITTVICERKVTKRTKIYDSKCAGFYVSITPAGVATFNLKYTNKATKKRESVEIGVYCPDILDVVTARTQAYLLKGRADNGADLAGERRREKAATVRQGKTVGAVIDEYLAWMRTPERKEDGEERATRESWTTTEQYLNGYAKPALGKMVASEVTSDDIAQLQEGLRSGALCKSGKPSVSNARHTRVALSKMFKWAAQAGRSYVKGNPCINLPELPPVSVRKHKLTVEEIRTLWLGLDREDLPCSRATALALKFELVTMMRSGEFRTGLQTEIMQHEDGLVAMHVPLKRVKRRRPLNVPLSGLALSILKEAARMHPGSPYLFSADGKAPLAKTTLSQALRGVTYKGIVKQRGICEWLGIRPFTPHDLRRTAAHLAQVKAQQPRWMIALCLDHQTDEDGKEVSSVTDEHYVQSQHMHEKQQVLIAWEAVLEDIIAGKLTDTAKVTQFRLAA